MRITGNPASGGKKPGTPTIGTATGGNASATVAYTAPTYVGKGGAVTYRALSTPGSLTGTGASPITVSGLTNGTAYTFQVRAETSYGVLGDYSSASNSTTPAFPSSYESIASVTLGSNTNTISFSSIPATYTSLQLRGLVRSTEAASTVGSLYVTYNSVSSYAYHNLYGDGTSALAAGSTGQTKYFVTATPAASSTASIFGVFIMDIHEYASTTKTKTFRTLAGNDQNGSGRIYLTSGFAPADTAAISTLTFSTDLQLATGSTIALYGIKGA